ncbi:hypothetical protein M408DRAFT_30865 [Serendipita vermifera MAFF 305830]|uniref:PNPLA domain-containing protein n=1 Tax=Serendipita vermifera MAFF 305830 TaxID=933852 RepID=A0A0C3AIC8_SERVB|nr:hypothetical protein M408DRAFT_30865 [Serendipita vermifera MAFF 305830]
MSLKDSSDEGICILSFDSGGPGTYSQLLILKNYMDQMAIFQDMKNEDLYPADYFDLMGGVGFGGLAAFMLGYLRMSVDEAIDALFVIAFTIFDESTQKGTPEVNMRNLKSVIETLLRAKQIALETRMQDKGNQSRCKV